MPDHFLSHKITSYAIPGTSYYISTKKNKTYRLIFRTVRGICFGTYACSYDSGARTYYDDTRDSTIFYVELSINLDLTDDVFVTLFLFYKKMRLEFYTQHKKTFL